MNERSDMSIPPPARRRRDDRLPPPDPAPSAIPSDGDREGLADRWGMGGGVDAWTADSLPADPWDAVHGFQGGGVSEDPFPETSRGAAGASFGGGRGDVGEPSPTGSDGGDASHLEDLSLEGIPVPIPGERGMEGGRRHVLALPALLASIFVPFGVPGVALGVAALRGIRRSGGYLTGHGMALSGIALGIVSLCVWSNALYSSMMGHRAIEDAAQGFFAAFTRCQDDEENAAKARSLMSEGLRLALPPPEDVQLGYDMADHLGRFLALGECTTSRRWSWPSAPLDFDLKCVPSFEISIPDATASVQLVREEGGEAWRVRGFSVESKTLGLVYGATGKAPLRKFVPDAW